MVHLLKNCTKSSQEKKKKKPARPILITSKYFYCTGGWVGRYRLKVIAPLARRVQHSVGPDVFPSLAAGTAPSDTVRASQTGERFCLVSGWFLYVSQPKYVASSRVRLYCVIRMGKELSSSTPYREWLAVDSCWERQNHSSWVGFPLTGFPWASEWAHTHVCAMLIGLSGLLKATFGSMF